MFGSTALGHSFTYSNNASMVASLGTCQVATIPLALHCGISTNRSSLLVLLLSRTTLPGSLVAQLGPNNSRMSSWCWKVVKL